jgi:long-subunit fatty acid transport protein
MNIKNLKSNIKYVIVLIALVSLLLPRYSFLTNAYAIDVKFSKVGTTSAQFLKIGVGRATGMGEAFSAIADDASASYFNPAGLAQLNTREIFVNHINWISDVNHDYISAALPMTNLGTLALSVTAVTMGDMERLWLDDPATRTREDDSTGLYFGAMDMAFAVSFARQITDKLSFGLTTKLITQSIWNMSATGAAFDLGLLYHTGFKSLRLAACVTNFGTSMSFSGLGLEFQDTSYQTKPRAQYKTTPTPLPTTFRFGLAYNIIDMDDNVLTAAVDVIHPNDINETIDIGLEYNFKKLFFLRAGYILNSDLNYSEAIKSTAGLSAGTGFIVNIAPTVKLRLDYCYRDMGWLKASHRLGAIIGF